VSSMQRTVEGDVLLHHLTHDESTLDDDLLTRSGRTARTLVKEGPLRLTFWRWHRVETCRSTARTAR